jgi:predicted nucleic acid-binding protein
MHLTVDTNILVNGFKRPSLIHLCILAAISSTRKTICMDSKGSIEREYRKNLSGIELFEKWHKEVVVDSRYSGSLSSRHILALEQKNCHEPSDHVFIAVAHESSDKILLTEDSDMGKGSKGHEEIHRQALAYLQDTLGLRVYDASEALGLLGIQS